MLLLFIRSFIRLSSIILFYSQSINRLIYLDAVAAGTVGAWTSLTATGNSNSNSNLYSNIDSITSITSSSFPPIIPEDSFELLKDLVERIGKDHSITLSLTTDTARAVAAFAFGLACGSASCLQEENSVLDAGDVYTLFKKMIHIRPPELIHTRSTR